MKYLNKTLGVTLILLFGWLPGFSQLFPISDPTKELGQADIVVTYLKTYQQDSLNSRLRDDKMTLLLGEKVSSFYSESVEAFRKLSGRKDYHDGPHTN